MTLPGRGFLLLFALAAVILAFIAMGCRSDRSSQAEDGSDSPATLTSESGWPRREGLRGARYCEVLLLELVDGILTAEVWNTIGLSECPQDEWEALNPAAIKTERGVLAALLNGPRYWLADAIEIAPSGPQPRTTFGTLDMRLGATVSLGPPPPDLAPYTERHVARQTVFEFSGGAEVYELVAPDGRVYVMQSYSVQNAAISEADLPALADRISPPAGWTYRARVVDADYRVATSASGAVVIQDELSNTYQLVVDASE
jgi:hypothetical protein